MSERTMEMLDEVEERFRRRGMSVDGKLLDLAVWKTLKLIAYPNVNKVISTLRSSHCCTGFGASKIMGGRSFRLTTKEREVNLVKISARQLGFHKSVHYANIFVRGYDCGLRSCPVDLAAQLRIQYTDQPEGEILRIIVKDKITDFYGKPRIFAVMKHCDRKLLDICGGWTDLCFNPDDVFVFIKPPQEVATALLRFS